MAAPDSHTFERERRGEGEEREGKRRRSRDLAHWARVIAIQV